MLDEVVQRLACLKMNESQVCAAPMRRVQMIGETVVLLNAELTALLLARDRDAGCDVRPMDEAPRRKASIAGSSFDLRLCSSDGVIAEPQSIESGCW